MSNGIAILIPFVIAIGACDPIEGDEWLDGGYTEPIETKGSTEVYFTAARAENVLVGPGIAEEEIRLATHAANVNFCDGNPSINGGPPDVSCSFQIELHGGVEPIEGFNGVVTRDWEALLLGTRSGESYGPPVANVIVVGAIQVDADDEFGYAIWEQGGAFVIDSSFAEAPATLKHELGHLLLPPDFDHWSCGETVSIGGSNYSISEFVFMNDCSFYEGGHAASEDVTVGYTCDSLLSTEPSPLFLDAGGDILIYDWDLCANLDY